MLSVQSGFEKLKTNLEITTLQRSTTSTRQQNVRDAVEKELTVLDSFLTGSYIRNTMIAPLSEADIDVFVVLHPSYYNQHHPAVVLDKVRNVLLKTYTKTPKISRNGQAVTITFDDFIVDVVPAFNRTGGGYLIPNSSEGTWISTNPKVHIDLLNTQNTYHNGKLVPLIKMVKRWNKYINQPFVSFYLELMVINTFTNNTIFDYESGMAFFFLKGKDSIRYVIQDPVPYGGKVKGLSGINVTEAVSRFETAWGRSSRAYDYNKKGYANNAFEEWQKVFGSYFPAY